MRRRRRGRRRGREDQKGKDVQETENVVSDCCISALPAALLVEVFVRVPTVVLMECKLVCTAWRKLLSESSFTNFYGTNSTFAHLLFTKERSDSVSSSQLLYLLEISEGGHYISRSIKIKFPEGFKRSPVEFDFRSVDGLLSFSSCYDGVEVSYISNPLTGECIQLPEHEKHLDEKKCVLCEIGFSPSVDKFKVLRILCEYNCEIEECEILTVGVDDRWRRLSLPFGRLFKLTKWISLNGVLHWINQRSSPSQISTFDLGEEKFDKILHPPGLSLDAYCMNLALFNHQLSLVDFSDPYQITLWTMRECAGEKSWTKDDVILGSWLPSSVLLYDVQFTPVKKFKNGDILFSYFAKLFYLSIKQKKCSEIGYFGTFGTKIRSTFMSQYPPSFKSL